MMQFWLPLMVYLRKLLSWNIGTTMLIMLRAILTTILRNTLESTSLSEISSSWHLVIFDNQQRNFFPLENYLRKTLILRTFRKSLTLKMSFWVITINKRNRGHIQNTKILKTEKNYWLGMPSHFIYLNIFYIETQLKTRPE